MTDDDAIALLTIVPLWGVCLYRLRHRDTAGKRALLYTFLTLAVGATLRLSGISALLDDLTGIQNSAILPKHLSVSISCVLLTGWVDSCVLPRVPEPRWRKLTSPRARMVVMALATTGLCGLFPFTAPADATPDGDVNFIGAQGGHLLGTAYLAFYLLPMAFALLLCALLCRVASHHPDSTRLFKLCMRFMAVGCWFGAVYPWYRGFFLVYGLTGAPFPLDADAVDKVASLIQVATILPVIAGSSVRVVDMVADRIRYRRWLIAIRPLWLDLIAVLPEDVMAAKLTVAPSGVADRWRIRDLWHRLDQRVLEISDAAYELLPWIDGDLPRHGLAAARASGLHGKDARAAAEAVCLRIARRAAAQDAPPAEDRPAAPYSPIRMSTDLATNARWLARVAGHYTSPLLDEIEETLTASRTTHR